MCSDKKDKAVDESVLLREILGTVPYAVAVVDTAMRYVAHSSRWTEAYNLPNASLIGRSHYEVFPEISPEWRQIHQECLAGAVRSRIDDPFPRIDGSIDYVTWQINPWHQPDGSIGGIIMYTTVSTSRVLAQRLSRQYKQEMEILLDTTRAVPWRLDIETKKFTFIGPQIEAILGYPAETWLDLDAWIAHIHPADRETALSVCINKTDDSPEHDMQYRVISASGEIIWLRDVAASTRDADKQIVATNGLFIDITEQKQAEQQLRTSEAQYRSVIETSGDGFWLLDSSGYLLHTNDAYARLSGYSKDELVGMHVSQLEAREHPDETAAHIKKIIENGTDLFETCHRKKNGDQWDVEISTSYSHDAGDKFFVFTRDISERKRTQRELRLIAEVFKNTSEGIVITDPKGKIVDVNPAYCNITGYSREEMIGENPKKIKSDRHDKEFYRQMWDSIITDGYWVGEIWDRRKNGEVFPKWLSINAVHDEEGSLTHYVGTFSDISVLKGIEKELEFMAYYDPLTGLPNRILFKDRLENEINHCCRQHTRCALLFLDLDRFKLINDTLGHTAGDELLVEVAHRLKSSIRNNDTIARMGGDEFTLLLTQLHSTDAAALVAQNVIKLLSQPFKIHGDELRIGASIGIAIYPDDGDNFTTLTRHADAAMYEAKDKGRGCYHFYSEYMDKTAHEHLMLERDLHRAVDEEQFFLVFQPQIEALTGKTLQCEALIRWEHPEHGMVPPDRFIPIAEETDLIHSIGDWVIREVCRQICQWRDAGVELPKVAINLSARQFRQNRLVERIMTILNEYQIDVDSIEFEITESVAMENADSTMRRLSALHQQGFSLAIDDFGTGYSSLSYLKRFPVHKLKLDRSFVQDIESDANDAAISSAVISMANSLGLDVVAEGVESEGQRDFLAQHGCRIMQGYLYSKPLASKDFLAFLQAK